MIVFGRHLSEGCNVAWVVNKYHGPGGAKGANDSESLSLPLLPLGCVPTQQMRVVLLGTAQADI